MYMYVYMFRWICKKGELGETQLAHTHGSKVREAKRETKPLGELRECCEGGEKAVREQIEL